MAKDWAEFWNGDHSIYVSDKHLSYHAQQIAEDVLQLPDVRSGALLLDYGCGDAVAAPRLVEGGLTVFLFDPSARITARNLSRFVHHDRIEVLGEADLNSLNLRFDMILVNSVLQYLPKSTLPQLLGTLRRLLSSNGVIYLGDVVPPGPQLGFDVYSLLRSGWRGNFVGAAMQGLFKNFFASYRQLRREPGLSAWSESEILHVLTSQGWNAWRMPKNIGPSPHRMLIRATQQTSASKKLGSLGSAV